jgi:DNA invertase Pin-like site-specific DNA recombinase
MRVAVYARVSTDDKDQNPETQLRPLREHLAGLGHSAEVVPVGEFVDLAGADDFRRRRAWRQLLELAQRRRVDLVVVWKLDRAFRSVLDGATTLQTLRAAGCGIRSLQEPWIDTTTPIGEAMYHITLAWAQLEKRQLAERVRAGMARARAEGKSVGRPRNTRRSPSTHCGLGCSARWRPGTSRAPRRQRSSACARRRWSPLSAKRGDRRRRRERSQRGVLPGRSIGFSAGRSERAVPKEVLRGRARNSAYWRRDENIAARLSGRAASGSAPAV